MYNSLAINKLVIRGKRESPETLTVSSSKPLRRKELRYVGCNIVGSYPCSFHNRVYVFMV